MAKAIDIQHPMPRPITLRRCLLPIGMYCNEKLQKASIGSSVEFWQEKKHEKAILTYKRIIRVNSAEFTDWLRIIYGERITIAKLMDRWEAWAVVEGIGAQGFSRDEAIVIEVCGYDDKSK